MWSNTTTRFDDTRQRERELNDRQRRVLDLIEKGHTNREIADILGMTVDGAKWNVSEILGKLALDSREDAAEYWRWRQRRAPAVVRAMARPTSTPIPVRRGLPAGLSSDTNMLRPTTCPVKSVTRWVGRTVAARSTAITNSFVCRKHRCRPTRRCPARRSAMANTYGLSSARDCGRCHRL